MPPYANQHDDSFLPCDMLREIAIVLKRGRTTQSKVMDFILILLGCIVSRIDHRSRLREFENVFSGRSLEILKNDLENLVHFNGRFFHSLILEFIVEALVKETKYRKRCIRLGANENTPIRQWNKVVFQRRVRAVVKFLVFRKLTSYIFLRDDSSVSEWSSYKRKISLVLNNEIDARYYCAVRKRSFPDRHSCTRNNRQENITTYIYSNARNAPVNGVEKSRKYWRTKSNFYDTFEQVGIGYLCMEIYCLLWYRWLWICLCYCCNFFHPMLMNIPCKLINDSAII